jgi:PAS domain S-box-containing protein
VLGKLAGWGKQVGESTLHLHRLNIGPRLRLGFLFIILALLVGNAVSLWQFHLARAQADRLGGVDQELIAVLQAHTSLMSFYEKLDALAHSKNTGQLVTEVEALRNAILQDSHHSRDALSRLPPEVQLDPALLPTLLSIQDSLPAELEAIAALAKSNEWEAVRLRIANQVRPLESRSSGLVENIDREVGEERAQAVLNIGQAQRRILLILPITAVLTLLFAAFLGSAITRSITQPLGRLMEGSTALSRGDFSHRVPAVGKDEIARLGNVFNDMVVRLQELYRELQRRETYLAEAQRLSHTGSFGWDVSTGEIHWSPETFRIFEYEPRAKATIDLVVQRIHPEDRLVVQQLIERVSRERTEFDFEHRLLMPDGSVKYLHVVGHPSTDDRGRFEFVGAVTDITERKHAEEALRRSEGYLTEAQRLTRSGSWAWDVRTRTIFWSQEVFRIYEFDPEKMKPTWPTFLERIHPEDRSAVELRAKMESTQKELVNSEGDFRIVLPHGRIKHLHTIAHPVMDDSGEITEVVGTVMDVTEQREARAALERSEGYLAEAQRLTRTGSWAWNVRTRDLFWSQEMFRVLDYPATITPSMAHFFERVHPEDRPLIEQRAKSESTQTGWVDSGVDYRIVLPNGTIRHLHSVAHPVTDASGELTEVVGTTMDVTEHHEARAALETAFDEIKALKDELQKENIVLREEIDRSSMFEEIVGTSPVLQKVLSRVSKVAPTDSSVLITGETGTGKELVARAIHRRSHRSSRAFVSVNCAAIPRDLVASELFGHEKGAFTGASQRRLGRFELAGGGTIFLDEVGELPAESQIALLRVLQEHEFDRVGGTRSIQTDVRVIAATNRDLLAAIAAGAFRSDLFYRLSVFPIEMPPLRQRREDIPLLVQYFIDRFARKAGKSIRGLNRKTLDLLQSYSWPGNIRELQNVIERSVIVCESENFSVDGSWLSRQPPATEPTSPLDFSAKLAAQEKEIIESALRETAGQVFGPSGAAAKLGMPRSTLESKIRSLQIDKNRFRT